MSEAASDLLPVVNINKKIANRQHKKDATKEQISKENRKQKYKTHSRESSYQQLNNLQSINNKSSSEHNVNRNAYTHSFHSSLYSDLERFEKTPFHLAMFSYISYLVLNLVGRFRDFIRCLGMEKHHMAREPEKTRHFVPLYQDYEAFFTRNLYRRIRDCWNRPVCSAPGAEFDLMDRWSPDHGWNFVYTGSVTRCLNFGSYNYLGFADPYSPANCAFGSSQEKRTNLNEATIRQLGVSVGYAPCQEALGSLAIQRDLENLIADFTGQEAAITFPMGFATNALNIPALVDKYCCIISDELNHTSLILGMRLSGAHVRRFRHNNMESLEKELKNAVVYGHPRYRRAYRKILIVVEGIYSMEGSIVRLPEIIALKQRYKAYLYLDEAHSVGALGPRGRGVADYYGVDPHQIDVAMGTFTKSFGSAGGYIAGKKCLIDWLRSSSHSTVYGATMSPVVCQQIINVLELLIDPRPNGEGQKTIKRLAWNTRYFRNALHRMGFIVYGHADSPVVPIIVYLPGKIPAISRACRERGVGIVVVGYPATPLLLCRARFCISAAHTKPMLDKALSVLDEVADMFRLRYSRMPLPSWVKAVNEISQIDIDDCSN